MDTTTQNFSRTAHLLALMKKGDDALASAQALPLRGGYSTLVQMNTVELCLPVIGLLLGPVLIYKDLPSMLN
jgi:hypothetical protein